MNGKCTCSRLNIIAFSGALGIIAGIIVMALAWAAWVWDYNTSLVQTWSALYPGYEASLKGGFFGLGWGLLQGVTVGIVFAWLYNSLCPCFSCSNVSCNSTTVEYKSLEPELKE
ncbi:MAG: hypothetical protein K0R24_1265 [Gammaproteobacteria bacterium]|jgi:hypothetical protein|nr:hypothetical protein [Gammaproteobacteria bacterium]MCE3238284.1 hypothetical protein [Gammaproteobacteria bacterium]